MIRSICKKLIKLKKKEKKYNLAPQTTTISSDSLPNYQGLHSCLKTTKIFEKKIPFGEISL
jgi:hypothetical protein